MKITLFGVKGDERTHNLALYIRIAQQQVLPVKVLSAVDIFVVICEHRTVNKRNTADLSTITK